MWPSPIFPPHILPQPTCPGAFPLQPPPNFPFLKNCFLKKKKLSKAQGIIHEILWTKAAGPALGKSINKHARALHGSKCSFLQPPCQWPSASQSFASLALSPTPALSLKAKLSLDELSHYFPPQPLPLSKTTWLKLSGVSQSSVTNEKSWSLAKGIKTVQCKWRHHMVVILRENQKPYKPVS